MLFFFFRFFFFNDTATTEIYTLSLHDALPISLKKYELKIYKLSVSERTKSFKVANKIIEQLLNDNFNKSDCVIAMGGGVLGDLSAFISNLTKRGLKFINIPTTLLAQADASDRKSTRLNSSHVVISYAVFCLKQNNPRIRLAR